MPGFDPPEPSSLRRGSSADANGATGYDADAVRAKYLAERDKRLVPHRADIRDLRTDQRFARYRDDPFAPIVERDPVADEVDVVIVGGGIAGVLAASHLRKAGIQRVRIIDQAGGIGGTWYWNRYPGVMCDVESYIYMPMLEELDYIPTRRYAFGEEIRTHLEAIADRFDLVTDALFHTGVTSAEWDEGAARWRIHTDRGDVVSCRWYVLAVGILNLMKLPTIPGMEDFAGRSFHTARWDYDYTGGGPDQPLTRLADKVVALIGTGASGIQCVPPLAESAEHLYVFQRTPSAIGERGNRPTDPDFADGLEPSWQRDRMDNFQAIIMGRPVEADLVDDGWTQHYAAVQHPPRAEGMSMADYLRSAEAFDYSIMENHRHRVEELVADPAKAGILKPYYRYLCKRPCFHDEYLQAFNNPNVTLIDCPAGIERITEQGPVVDGKQFDVDCIIYGTGFEAELTPLFRRVGHRIVGRGGIALADKWADGAASLFGMMSRGFPNMFVMPAPGQQAVVTVNYTQLAVLGAEFIGGAIGLLDQRGVDVFDVSAAAEEGWTKEIVDTFVDSSAVMSACTPSRINNEGHPEAMNPRNTNYGRGFGDWFGYREVLEEWLRAGSLEGLDLEVRVDGIVSRRQRVAVVTGGGGGIGAAIAEDLGRGGWFVVTLDPLVTLDGSEQLPEPEETTAGRIVAAGGSARATSVSVTDGEGVRALFEELAEQHGGLDAVVNVAGITRQTYFGRGTEEDWLAVLAVHLGGYLNVLDAALPLMAAAGYGRVLGVTSGSGWRAADAGAYSCAKRAVASLTWQLGRQAPPGVTVNAMSPIAATRMMASALERARKAGLSGGGGISFLSVAGPEDLGPLGAYLVGEDFGWCRGRVLFAAGSEVAIVDEPRLLEVVRSDQAVSLPRVLEAVIPLAFAKAEASQATEGGSNPRFGPIFDEPAPDRVAPSPVLSCAVVTDRPGMAASLTSALEARSITCHRVEVARGFDAAAKALSAVAETAGPIDAVVVAPAADRSTTSADGWERVLAEHRGIVEHIHTDAGWARAAADYAAGAGRPVRLVTLTDATTTEGRSRAQASAQHARVAVGATEGRVTAFAASIEASEQEAGQPVAELAAHLLTHPDATTLAGAELVLGGGWLGLRSHPRPIGSVTYGGPAIPDWLDATLREIAGAAHPPDTE